MVIRWLLGLQKVSKMRENHAKNGDLSVILNKKTMFLKFLGQSINFCIGECEFPDIYTRAHAHARAKGKES